MGDAFERFLAESDSDDGADALDRDLRARAAREADAAEARERRAGRAALRAKRRALEEAKRARGDMRSRDEEIIDIFVERLVKELEVTYERPLLCAEHVLGLLIDRACEEGELELEITRQIAEDRALRAELAAAGAFDVETEAWQRGVRSMTRAEGKAYGTAAADSLDALLAGGGVGRANSPSAAARPKRRTETIAREGNMAAAGARLLNHG